MWVSDDGLTVEEIDGGLRSRSCVATIEVMVVGGALSDFR